MTERTEPAPLSSAERAQRMRDMPRESTEWMFEPYPWFEQEWERAIRAGATHRVGSAQQSVSRPSEPEQ